mmetsp:Transcript_8810/g.19064  ORF Transcript_8810/g.19064 Transcript_8810/m.19064 type:complete len:214 (+) Transcript_8810:574-1215(+)
MLEAEGGESRNRKPDRDHLAAEVLAEGGHVHRHAHQPVAQDPSDQSRLERESRLGGGDPNRGTPADECAPSSHHGSHEQRAYEVPAERDYPRLEQLRQRSLALKHCGGDEGRVASEELSARHECHHQAKWETKRAKNHLLESRVCGCQARARAADRDHEESTKSNVNSGEDRQQENFVYRHVSLFDTCGNSAIIPRKRSCDECGRCRCWCLCN